MNTTVTHSDSIAALSAALSKAQGTMRNPPKDTLNTFFKSQYADLAAVRDAVIPALSANGLCVMQMLTETDNAPALMTMLSHSSGEWLKTIMLIRPVKQDPQGIGSASTYARRYALQSIAGVAAEVDDDGNEGSQAGKPKTNHKPAPAEVAPDQDLVNGIEGQLKECTNRAELAEIGKLIKAQKNLTDSGINHLRSVFAALDKKLPQAA